MANVHIERVIDGEVRSTNVREFATVTDMNIYREKITEIANELYGAFGAETDGIVTIVRNPDDTKNRFYRYTFTY